MLNNAKTLELYKLNRVDGEIGKVKDFYFDDQHWTIRYLIADTGSWLSSRKVLISPYSIASVNKVEEHINVDLTKSQIENSPPLDSDKPVSKQFQEELYTHFNYPLFWGGMQSGPMGMGMATVGFVPYHLVREDKEKTLDAKKDNEVWDPNLRSVDNVIGYHVQSTDDEIGHIDDFIIDDETWQIKYLVIDTKNWLPGKKVLISPRWIKDIIWEDSIINVDLSSEKIKASEPYDENLAIEQDYEVRLYEHYNRLRKWPDSL